MFFYIVSSVTVIFGILIILDPSAPITPFGIPKGNNVEDIKWLVGGVSIVIGIVLFYSEIKKS